MTTAAARRSMLDLPVTVVHRRALARFGVGAHRIDANVAAGRWQRVGPAVILHNAPLTVQERQRVALINCGPRAAYTSFTAVAQWGLTGWSRPLVHVLAPAGTTHPGLPWLRLHRTGEWDASVIARAPRRHLIAPALVVAAGSFERSRPGCGLLAAGVQQRLTTAAELGRALDAAPRIRHRRQLVLAVADIAQGSQALSEIDFVRLCRRSGLPEPTRQAVRVIQGGRRRYLDAEWRLRDGRLVAVEVDGAPHMKVEQWSADQLRQNEVVIDGTLVLRYASVIVRDEPHLVVEQLRRVLRS